MCSRCLVRELVAGQSLADGSLLTARTPLHSHALQVSYRITGVLFFDFTWAVVQQDLASLSLPGFEIMCSRRSSQRVFS